MSYAVKAYVVPFESVNSYPVWLNEPLIIGTFGSLKEVSKEFSVDWDATYWKPTSAKLYAKASQPYQSGATVLFRLNDHDVAEFHWGAVERDGKEDTKEVLTYLANGLNRLYCRYSIAFPAITEQRCEVTATLQVTFQYIGPPGEEEQHPPPTPGVTPVWPWWWWIAGLGAGVGVIGIAGVIMYQEQQRMQMMMLMLAGRRRE